MQPSNGNVRQVRPRLDAPVSPIFLHSATYENPEHAIWRAPCRTSKADIIEQTKQQNVLHGIVDVTRVVVVVGAGKGVLVVVGIVTVVVVEGTVNVVVGFDVVLTVVGVVIAVGVVVVVGERVGVVGIVVVEGVVTVVVLLMVVAVVVGVGKTAVKFSQHTHKQSRYSFAICYPH